MEYCKCKRCKESKLLNYTFFRKELRNKSGFAGVCRLCENSQSARNRRENIEKYRIIEARAREKQREKGYRKEYYKKNREKALANGRDFYLKNKEICLERAKKQRERLYGSPEYKKYYKEYREFNREKLNKYVTDRLKTDIQFRMRFYLSSSLRKHIQRKTKSTIDYLGCSIIFFMDYIASKFIEGMSWDNYGKVWHLDHILPCRAFDLSKQEEISKCFHYSNFQPLFAVDNLKKLDMLPCGQYARKVFPRKSCK